MKVFEASFSGLCIAGSAVVVAEDEQAARSLVVAEIQARIRSDTDQEAAIRSLSLEQLPTDKPGLYAFNDGNL
jgi:hypothetical protein